MKSILLPLSLGLAIAACSPQPIALPPPEPSITVSGTMYAPEARLQPLRLLALRDEQPLKGTIYFRAESGAGDTYFTDESGGFNVSVPPQRTYTVTVTLAGEVPEYPAVSYIVTGTSNLQHDFGVADFVIGSKLHEVNPKLFHPGSTTFLRASESSLDRDRLAEVVDLMEQELKAVQPLPGPSLLKEAVEVFDQYASEVIQAKVHALMGVPYTPPPAQQTAEAGSTVRETLYFTFSAPSSWRPTKIEGQRLVNGWDIFDGVSRVEDGKAIATVQFEQTTSDVTLDVIKDAWVKNAGDDEIEVEEATVAGEDAYLVTRTVVQAEGTLTIRKYLIARAGRVFSIGMFFAADAPNRQGLIDEFDALVSSVAWRIGKE